MPDSREIRKLFADISENYDAANHLLSGGIDIYWRMRLSRLVAKKHPKNVGDFATGSGDVAFALQRKLGPSVRVSGFDFCPEMLAQAEAKKRNHPIREKITFTQADCMDLGAIPRRPFDVGTVAFGVRNFPDRFQGFCELRNCLREGGSLFVLEFSQPYRWLKPFYRAYLKHVLPLLARCLTRDKDAYRYLTQSIESFPEVNQITDELRRSGFSAVNVWRLTGGIVAIHEAIR